MESCHSLSCFTGQSKFSLSALLASSPLLWCQIVSLKLSLFRCKIYMGCKFSKEQKHSTVALDSPDCQLSDKDFLWRACSKKKAPPRCVSINHSMSQQQLQLNVSKVKEVFGWRWWLHTGTHVHTNSIFIPWMRSKWILNTLSIEIHLRLVFIHLPIYICSILHGRLTSSIWRIYLSRELSCTCIP